MELQAVKQLLRLYRQARREIRQLKKDKLYWERRCSVAESWLVSRGGNEPGLFDQYMQEKERRKRYYREMERLRTKQACINGRFDEVVDFILAGGHHRMSAIRDHHLLSQGVERLLREMQHLHNEYGAGANQ